MKSLSIDNVLLSDDFSSPVTVHKDNDCYVPTNSHEEILLALEKSILVHDVCLVGERGTGKSTLVKQLATRLSQTLEPIILYQVKNLFLSSFLKKALNYCVSIFIGYDCSRLAPAKNYII